MDASGPLVYWPLLLKLRKIGNSEKNGGHKFCEGFFFLRVASGRDGRIQSGHKASARCPKLEGSSGTQ